MAGPLVPSPPPAVTPGEAAPDPPVRWPAVAAAAGAAWGFAGYLLLWGHTPVVVNRRFAVSALGMLAFWPVKVVLRGIRFAEESIAGRPFDLSSQNAWIGPVAALVGAAALGGAALAVRRLARFRLRRYERGGRARYP